MNTINRIVKKALGSLLVMTTACLQVQAQVNMETNSNVANPVDPASAAVFARGLLPASPTASMFAIYGQTTVNEFTGTPDISIPLYAVNYKDLSVPLTLSYQGGNGLKPASLPGPVGNGWLLTSGGVITRISKGMSPGSLLHPDQYNGSLNLTANSTWNTTDLQTDIRNPNLLANSFCQYDEYSYSFAGLSGKFYTAYNGVKHFKTLQGEDLTVTVDLVDAITGKTIALPAEPQNMVVDPGTAQEVGSYTPSIIMKQTPYRFTLTDSHGNKYIFGGTDESIEFLRSGRSIHGSTAGPNDWDGYTIDAVSWYLTSIQSPNGYHIDFVYQRDHFYVTSEAYVATNTVSYASIAQPCQTPQNPNATGLCFDMLAPNARLVKSTLINPTYLQKIITPLNTVQFHWSTADQQLGYKLHNNGYSGANANVTVDAGWSLDGDYCDVQFDIYRDVVASSPDNRFPDKLEYFTVYDANGVTAKNVHFNYNNDVTKRLHLTSVELRGNDDDAATAQVYGFTYNSTYSLPDYLTFSGIDVYGYYNGAPTDNTYIVSDVPGYYRTNFPDATWRQNYLSTRVPNATYAQAEILQRVTYPTGGYTQYDYEANDYSRVYQNWPPTTTENTSSAVMNTAGVRIHKTTNYDFASHIAGSKTYHYVKNYVSGPQSSSGVLNYIPLFFEANPDYPSGTNITPPANMQKLIDNNPDDAADLTHRFSGSVKYLNFGTDPINPMSYNKISHITYSEVTEENADGSFVVHTYKNYDNGAADHSTDVHALYDNQGISNLWKEDDMSSMDLERGQVTSEALYDNSGSTTPKRLTTYVYNDDNTRFADIQDVGQNVRLLKCIPGPLCNTQYLPSLRYVATMVYTYYPYLKQTVVTENENGNSLTTTTSYTYDASYKVPVQQQTTSSKGETLTNITSYPQNMGGASPYDVMVSNHQVSIPVQQQQFVMQPAQANNPMHAQITNFSSSVSPNALLVLPAQAQTQFKSDAPETRVNYLQYDDMGNPLAVAKEGGMTTCFVWGYNKTYPVAKIENAQYSDVQTALGGATAVNDFAVSTPGADNTVRSFLAPLRTSPLLSNAMVTTYTYHSVFGVTSETSPANQTIYYDYDNMGRLSLVRDNDKNVLKRICYNYANQAGACAGSFGNQAISQVITKNDCSSGFPTSVTYPVAAGAFQSNISQADANQKAFNDVVANGQAYANANGTCLCTSCSGVNATEGVKCINGQCETGVKVYTSRFHSTIIPNSPYFCVYHYEFSDGSWSENYSVQSPNPC